MVFGSEVESTTDLIDRAEEALQSIGHELSEIGESIASAFLGAADTIVDFFTANDPTEDYGRSRQFYARVLQSAVQGLRIGARLGYAGAIFGAFLGGAMAAFLYWY